MNLTLENPPAARPDNPWLIAESSYPMHGTAEEQWEFLVGYAVLAPSRFNRQPWSFTLHDGALDLRLNPARLLPVTDPRGREAIMNCGTALYYLQVAMRYFGHEPLVEILPVPTEEGLLASVSRGQMTHPTEGTKALFHAIRHRRTERRSFNPEPIPSDVFRSLYLAATGENASLVFLEEPEHRHAVADMVVEGESLLQQNPDYRAEAHAGVAARSAAPAPAERIAAMVTHLWETFAPYQIDTDLVLDAPALAVLGTDGDTPYDWLAAGQALGAVLLTADTFGVQASFLNQPVEVLSIRPRLQQLVGGIVPQLILRLGFMEGDYLPHSTRQGMAALTLRED